MKSSLMCDLFFFPIDMLDEKLKKGFEIFLLETSKSFGKYSSISFSGYITFIHTRITSESIARFAPSTSNFRRQLVKRSIITEIDRKVDYPTIEIHWDVPIIISW